jgi:hypothetical protein
MSVSVLMAETFLFPFPFSFHVCACVHALSMSVPFQCQQRYDHLCPTWQLSCRFPRSLHTRWREQLKGLLPERGLTKSAEILDPSPVKKVYLNEYNFQPNPSCWTVPLRNAVKYVTNHIDCLCAVSSKSLNKDLTIQRLPSKRGK